MHPRTVMDGDCWSCQYCLEQHPSAPVLAVSGLDHDVKVFTPCSLLPTSLGKLEHIVTSNKKERDTEREEIEAGGEIPNEYYIYYRRLRRILRRAGGNEDEDGDNNNNNNPSDNSDSDDSDTDMGQLPGHLRCDPS